MTGRARIARPSFFAPVRRVRAQWAAHATHDRAGRGIVARLRVAAGLARRGRWRARIDARAAGKPAGYLRTRYARHVSDAPTNFAPHRPRRSAKAWVAVVVAFAALPVVAYVRNRPLPPEAIAWRTDFDAALRDSAETGRPVLMDVTAPWCPPCQEMKRSTWPDPRVGAAIAASFTPALVDCAVPAGQAVAQRYGVDLLPVVAILEADGSVRMQFTASRS